MNTVIIITLSIVILGLLFKEWYTNRKNKLNKEVESVDMNSWIPTFVYRVKQAQTLYELYALHIQIYAFFKGKVPNINPDKFGMFRCDNILTMKPTDVYLGNTYGLLTKELPFWIGKPDEHIVLNQYKYHLINNLEYFQNIITKQTSLS